MPSEIIIKLFNKDIYDRQYANVGTYYFRLSGTKEVVNIVSNINVETLPLHARGGDGILPWESGNYGRLPPANNLHLGLSAPTTRISNNNNNNNNNNRARKKQSTCSCLNVFKTCENRVVNKTSTNIS